jgi:hypothetical protein
MQFLLDGLVYDTAKSTRVAVARGVITPVDNPYHLPEGAESKRYEDVLYRTGRGNFFVHSHETVKYPRGKPVVQDEAWTVDANRAVDWIEKEGAMILDPTGLPLPGEG